MVNVHLMCFQSENTVFMYICLVSSVIFTPAEIPSCLELSLCFVNKVAPERLLIFLFFDAPFTA